MLIEIIDRVDETNAHAREDVLFIAEGLNTLESFTVIVTAVEACTASQLDRVANHSLPVTFVDGSVVKEGAYLTHDEWMQQTGVFFELDTEHVCGEECSCGH